MARVDGTVTFVAARRFLRGDVNGNGDVSAIRDGLALLNWGFNEGDEPPCLDAADADGNDRVSALADGLFLLGWGFTGGTAPPDPGPHECGLDPEMDDLSCDAVADTCET